MWDVSTGIAREHFGSVLTSFSFQDILQKLKANGFNTVRCAILSMPYSIASRLKSDKQQRLLLLVIPLSKEGRDRFRDIGQEHPEALRRRKGGWTLGGRARWAVLQCAYPKQYWSKRYLETKWYQKAETNGGGLALWGSDGSMGDLRTSDETYYQAWIPWIQALGKIVAANQITNGGVCSPPVINPDSAQ